MRRPLTLAALLLCACGPKMVETHYPDGSVHTSVGWSNRGARHKNGPVTEHYPDGKINHTGQHREGLKHGVWEFFWPGGGMRERQEFDHGQRDGVFSRWWENNQKQSEGAWVTGEKHGTWDFWTPDGALTAREEWDQGTRQSLERYEAPTEAGDGP